MKAPRREGLLAMLLTAMLATAGAWTHGQYADARRSADGAAEDLRGCAALVDRIAALRRRPNLAGAEELQLDVLARQAERAAERAGIEPGGIVRIWPEAARRVDETVYKEKATRIVLKDVSAEQVAAFLHALSGATPGLWTRSLRLSAPRGNETIGETGETWTVEAVVSYLIYAPPPRR